MKKYIKTITLMFSLLMITGLFAGCGTEEKMGYVDRAKIMVESTKSKELQKKFEDKSLEIKKRLEDAKNTKDEKEFAQMQNRAQEELGIYKTALQKEFENYIESNLSAIAKEKELGIIVDKQVITNGGIDVTEDLLKRIGKEAGATEEKK